jgi:4'-phosphopantetheinyl transferase
MKGASARSAGPTLSLVEQVMHVWCLNLDDTFLEEREWTGLLSADELQRAWRFRFPTDSRRFAIARTSLRMLLAGYLGDEPAKISFHYSDHGKPSLAGAHASNRLRFNVSHSGNVAIFAFVLDRNVGVDIERVHTDIEVDAVAQRFFSPYERLALAALPTSEKHLGFFNCWTRKEAFVKAVGQGLSLPLESFDVSLRLGEPARLLATRPDTREAERWTMIAPGIQPEHVAAIVVEGPGMELKVQKFKFHGDIF